MSRLDSEEPRLLSSLLKLKTDFNFNKELLECVTS